MKVKCTQPSALPVVLYPAAAEAAAKQADIFWLPDEPDVEKDLGCVLTELTHPEKHGVLCTLKLFTLYELHAGVGYWGDRFLKIFPRFEFQRMGLAFANIEMNVHAPFYMRIDELLGLNTPEFYESFIYNETLAARMKFIQECVQHQNPLVSIAAFSLVEGCVLYSSFAFLMHFQANGKNKLPNLQSGLAFSVRDENLHAESGAWAYRTLKHEMIQAGALSDQDITELNQYLLVIADTILQHESEIINLVFSEGTIAGCSATQMRHFVEHRLNICLDNLEVQNSYKPKYNPIADWFYPMIGGDAQHDFFYKVGSGYNRNWSESKFTWATAGSLG